MMKGWNANKIAVIGRNMEDRVKPFAQKLEHEMGIPVHHIQQWEGWSPNLSLEENRNWVKLLKEQGYTIYDVGVDPAYPPENEIFYGMEVLEIFGN